MQRYFIEKKLDKLMHLSEREVVHHMHTVMRNNPGEEICLVNAGQEAVYFVSNINSSEVSLELVHFIEDNNELDIKVDAAIGFLKKDNFELSLQKLVELGVNQVIPVKFERNVVKLDGKWEKKQKRYQDILKSAAKQSRRNYIPEILSPQKVGQLDLAKYDLVIVCYELEKEQKLSDLEQKIKQAKNILFVIGPEGGITAKEISVFTENENVVVITLGKRILRAETAVISTMGNIAMMIEKESTC